LNFGRGDNVKLYICENVKNAKWRENIPDDKKLSYAFMKKCVCDFIGEKESEIKIKISKNEYGKPFLQKIYKAAPQKTKKIKTDLSVHFSLSHSENMMICAVACFNIGADCQKKSLESLETCQKIARRYYAKEENVLLDSILSAGETGEEAYIDKFFSIWAKKEAYIKYTGKGMAEGLSTFSAAGKNYLNETRFKRIYLKNPEKNNFYIYLCCNKENKNILKIKYFK
jgi:phosphopantetheinyl transferase